MTTKNYAKLTQAMQRKTLVKFWNPYDEGSTQGYVLDIGPRFFLLALIGEDMRFNGFQCLLLSDIRRLQVPSKYADFVTAALRKRGESILRKPRIKLNTLPELLESASRLFPLMAIHQERLNPDTCKIGRAIGANKSHEVLLEIGPDALWEEVPTAIPFREITRVDFGGDYEEALYIVGGTPDLSKCKPQKTPRSSKKRASIAISARTPGRS
jgi:hypothetical protein